MRPVVLYILYHRTILYLFYYYHYHHHYSPGAVERWSFWATRIILLLYEVAAGERTRHAEQKTLELYPVHHSLSLLLALVVP